ncbi:DUF11 domain-containing protein [Streptomyces sp. AK02-04a]|uniref:DUF11 domain-containing protein n=1 Tax=Streptomyces sp. AK02-04a TaxID=3028649 RepID=UPI0029BC21F3|nr:DUF11 domain-containing protein [Streptomyces sp. AK02-04a]MDX3763424.1 DUF11 domain-containing protein [Streptomyces sp. AK02-04a]
MKKHSRRMLGIMLTVGGAAGALGLLGVPPAAAAAGGADLSVAKAGPALENAGDAVSYEIVVTNYGPDASSGWTLTDQVPTGLLNATVTSTDANCGQNGGTISCQGSALPAGSSAIVHVTGTAGPGGSRLTNTVTVDGVEPDPNTDNNVSSANTNVVAIPMIDPVVGARAVAAAAVATAGVALHRRRGITGAAL